MPALHPVLVEFGELTPGVAGLVSVVVISMLLDRYYRRLNLR